MASRTVTLFIETSRGTAITCPTCQFDSLEQITMHILTRVGVTERHLEVCPRCAEQADNNQE